MRWGSNYRTQTTSRARRAIETALEATREAPGPEGFNQVSTQAANFSSLDVFGLLDMCIKGSK